LRALTAPAAGTGGSVSPADPAAYPDASPFLACLARSIRLTVSRHGRPGSREDLEKEIMIIGTTRKGELSFMLVEDGGATGLNFKCTSAISNDSNDERVPGGLSGEDLEGTEMVASKMREPETAETRNGSAKDERKVGA
jgi:hypothetical protein